MKGLNGQSGSVAGDASNATSSEACSSRRSASARPCGESHSSAARRSASYSRFGDSSTWTHAAASGPSTNSSARCEPLDRRRQERRLGERQLACANHAEHDAVERPVAAADEQQRGKHEDVEQPDAVDRPADERECAGDAEEEQPRLRQIANGDEPHYVSSGSPRPSSSSRPRGGQSSFCGASQRLEQWSEAMFCNGTRMWPFSSMWATSST